MEPLSSTDLNCINYFTIEVNEQQQNNDIGNFVDDVIHYKL